MQGSNDPSSYGSGGNDPSTLIRIGKYVLAWKGSQTQSTGGSPVFNITLDSPAIVSLWIEYGVFLVSHVCAALD